MTEEEWENRAATRFSRSRERQDGARCVSERCPSDRSRRDQAAAVRAVTRRSRPCRQAGMTLSLRALSKRPLHREIEESRNLLV